MEQEKISRYQQKISGILDSLFTKVISGTTIEVKNMDRYHSEVNKLSRLIFEMADQIALERCNKLNKAILEAFNRMEEDLDKRFNSKSE